MYLFYDVGVLAVKSDPIMAIVAKKATKGIRSSEGRALLSFKESTILRAASELVTMVMKPNTFNPMSFRFK